MGYQLAGWDVVGVDINPQPRYPFEFHQADAVQYLVDHWQEFDAVHASPPCQRYSLSTPEETRDDHPDLVGPTRDALNLTGLPWIMENVPGAPLDHPVTLCGAAFGLTDEVDGLKLVLRRHRLFESNVWITPVECECLLYRDAGYQVATITGGGGTDNRTRPPKPGQRKRGGYQPDTEACARIMGTPWMSLRGTVQAIPPAFTRYLGTELLENVA